MAQKTGGTTNFADTPSNDYAQYLNPSSISGSNDPYGLSAGTKQAPQQATNMPYQAAPEMGGQTTGNALGDTNFGSYNNLSGQPATQSSFTNGSPQGYNSFGGAQMSYGNTGMNPYLDQMEKALTEGSNKNLNDVILPGINRSANAVGGYGGARQGLAQGNAIGAAQTGLNSTIANMRSGAYESAANRSLQSAALNNQSGQSWMNYDLGRRGLDLQGRGQDYGFYTNNRGQDLQELLAGAGLLQQGNSGLLGQGQGIYGLGATENQAGQNQLSWLSSILGGYAGLGATNTSTQQYQYNPWMQAAGMGIAGAGALGGLGWKPLGASTGGGTAGPMAWAGGGW